MDTPLYTNLKRQTMLSTDDYATENGTTNGSMQSSTNQSIHCSEPVHFVNIPASASPAHVSVATPTTDESSMIGTYQSNYTFGTNIELNHDVTAQDYGNNVSAHSANANHPPTHLNGLNNTAPGTHQRRGSLQLWQFLVALLDEPESRYLFAPNVFWAVLIKMFSLKCRLHHMDWKRYGVQVGRTRRSSTIMGTSKESSGYEL